MMRVLNDFCVIDVSFSFTCCELFFFLVALTFFGALSKRADYFLSSEFVCLYLKKKRNNK